MAKLHGISEACKDEHRKADVVFIHGLGGDAFGTWRYGEDEKTSWPHWLAEAFPDVGVWSLGHAADPSRWVWWWNRILFWKRRSRLDGQAMSLPERAGQVLNRMRHDLAGERPIIFVCHSLGGLLCKQILRKSVDSIRRPELQQISRRTSAVLFLATPHQGAALASMLNQFSTLLRTTVSVEELKAHDAHLGDLFDWYRNHSGEIGIRTVTFYENLDKYSVRIVTRTTAHPGVGDDPVALDEDHLSIAKPGSPTEDVCVALKELVQKALAKPGPGSDGSSEPVPEQESGDSDSADTTASPIPRDLQPPGYAFRGRTDLMAALIGRLQQGRSTAVVGDAGVGKTALIVEALQRVLGREPGEQQAALSLSRFADGIVFLDLYRYHGQAEPAWGALATERGEPTKDSGGNEIPSLQRAIAACSGKRLLLVVEGGEEARGTTESDGFVRTTRAALLDPLPLQQSTVLWLSRRSDQWPTHDTLSLDDPLGDEDARALFDELAADPAAGAQRVAPPMRDRALTLLHGHPLAITWTAALMASGNVAIADLLTDLADQPSLSLHDPQQKAHTLAWLFDRSVRGLDADARRSLLAAGLLAADTFPRAAIAAATSLDDRTQRVALEACLAARLLRLDDKADAENGVPGYRFSHALAYGYAREQSLAESDVAAVLLPGLAEWVHATLQACLAINPPRVDMAPVTGTLAHAFALLAADTPPRLWRPLVYALLYDFGDRFEEIGQLAPAVSAREAVARWLTKAQSAQPEESHWLWQAGSCHDRQGTLDIALGDLLSARTHYEAALVIADRLVMKAPTHAVWQGNLSVSHGRMGAVLQELGDLLGAQHQYEISLEIAEKLIKQDPVHADWQHNLSVSRELLGEVRQAQGDFTEAKQHFSEALLIREILVERHPGNTIWLRDLSVIHNKLGFLQQAQGDLLSAQKHYEAALAIREHLVTQDPQHTDLLRRLSISYGRLGGVQLAQGDVCAARNQYETALDILDRLATQDAANAGWQRDLAVCRIKLANACEADGDALGSLSHLQVARSILQALRQRAPDHPGFESDLVWVEQRIAVLEGGAAP